MAGTDSRCPFYRGVRLIEVDVRVSRLYFHLPLQRSLLLFLGLETLFNCLIIIIQLLSNSL